MAVRYSLSDEVQIRNFMEIIGEMRLAGKKPMVEILDENRTLPQNDMFHALYKEISQQKPDETFNDIRRHCKLHYGVPILRLEDEEFRVFYNKSLLNLDYEDKLTAMEFVPVTSRMKKNQGSKYIDDIIMEFSKQGLFLAHPSERYEEI